jgi:hypothetical protein
VVQEVEPLLANGKPRVQTPVPTKTKKLLLAIPNLLPACLPLEGQQREGRMRENREAIALQDTYFVPATGITY